MRIARLLKVMDLKAARAGFTPAELELLNDHAKRDWRAAIAAARVPVLFIAGRESEFWPCEHAAAAASLAPKGTSADHREGRPRDQHRAAEGVRRAARPVPRGLTRSGASLEGLAGIQDPVRVERGLDVAVHRDARARRVRARAPGSFSRPTPCSPVTVPPRARQSSTIRSNAVLRTGLGGVIALGRDDERVQVAVAGMRDRRDHDVVRGGRVADPREHLGHGTPRHADVLGQHRAEPLERRVREPPREEQPLDLVG